MASIQQIQQQIAGLKTQEDLNKFFATSGYTADQLAQAAPQFGGVGDYQAAMAKGAQAYAATQPAGMTFGPQRFDNVDPTQAPLTNGGPQDPGRMYRGGSPAFSENAGAAQPAPQPSPTAAPVGRTSGFFSTNEADNALPNWDLMPGQSRADHPFPGANSAGAPNNGSGYAAGMGPPVSGPGSAGSGVPYVASPTSFGGGGVGGRGASAGPYQQAAGALTQAAASIPAWQPQAQSGNVMQGGQTVGGQAGAGGTQQAMNWGANQSGAGFNTPGLDALYNAQKQRMGALTQAISG